MAACSKSFFDECVAEQLGEAEQHSDDEGGWEEKKPKRKTGTGKKTSSPVVKNKIPFNQTSAFKVQHDSDIHHVEELAKEYRQDKKIATTSIIQYFFQINSTKFNSKVAENDRTIKIADRISDFIARMYYRNEECSIKSFGDFLRNIEFAHMVRARVISNLCERRFWQLLTPYRDEMLKIHFPDNYTPYNWLFYPGNCNKTERYIQEHNPTDDDAIITMQFLLDVGFSLNCRNKHGETILTSLATSLADKKISIDLHNRLYDMYVAAPNELVISMGKGFLNKISEKSDNFTRAIVLWTASRSMTDFVKEIISLCLVVSPHNKKVGMYNDIRSRIKLVIDIFREGPKINRTGRVHTDERDFGRYFMMTPWNATRNIHEFKRQMFAATTQFDLKAINTDHKTPEAIAAIIGELSSSFNINSIMNEWLDKHDTKMFVTCLAHSDKNYQLPADLREQIGINAPFFSESDAKICAMLLERMLGVKITDLYSVASEWWKKWHQERCTKLIDQFDETQVDFFWEEIIGEVVNDSECFDMDIKVLANVAKSTNSNETYKRIVAEFIDASDDDIERSKLRKLVV
jgi:hypothetical protein